MEELDPRLTNDVPIRHLMDRSPSLWGKINRLFTDVECDQINELFLAADKLDGNVEIFTREKGVTFNPKLARVAQIALEGIPKDKQSLSLIAQCFYHCCEDKTSFKDTLTNLKINAINETETTVAKNALNLDILRHLHLTNMDKLTITQIIDDAKIEVEQLKKSLPCFLATQIESTISRHLKIIPK